ncbi:LacI family DNA-binding transcriptional regulator [Curtobacterium flaccumfaciens]|uniref:LacI family DNA-binding transcriptional regulator n=1 Tax=Curtobacterium flaccumfaciens TaxID=2035 RepID=UPI00343CEDF7
MPPSPRRVTLDEVAARAGVSKATASKVLNRRAGTSPETRRRVEGVLREMDYVPVTRERTVRESGSLVAVFDTLVSLYSLNVLEGLVDAAQASDLELVTHVARSENAILGLDRSWLQRIVDRGHAGLIIVTTVIDDEFLTACSEFGIPVVAVDAPAGGREELVSIGSDHFRGGLQAVRHLVELGHRRIAFVGGDPANPGLRERLGGYREGLAEAGVTYDPALVSEAGMATADQIVPTLLSLDEPPTAIFATNDGDAALAVRALQLAGLAVPEDVSVIGYDDTYSATPAYPALSTIHTPMQGIGRLAVEVLSDLAQGIEPISRRIQLATSLVQRESTCPPPANKTARRTSGTRDKLVQR